VVGHLGRELCSLLGVLHIGRGTICGRFSVAGSSGFVVGIQVGSVLVCRACLYGFRSLRLLGVPTLGLRRFSILLHGLTRARGFGRGRIVRLIVVAFVGPRTVRTAARRPCTIPRIVLIRS